MHLANSGFVGELWRQVLLLPHPGLVLISAILCAPILWPLSGLFMPVGEKPGHDLGDPGFGSSGHFAQLLVVWLLMPLLIPLLSLSVVLVLYGGLTALVYRLLVHLLG